LKKSENGGEIERTNEKPIMGMIQTNPQTIDREICTARKGKQEKKVTAVMMTKQSFNRSHKSSGEIGKLGLL